MNTELLQRVKQNLIIEFSADDSLINSYITASISYAEGYQHLAEGYYSQNPMSHTTQQAVIMLASFFYESRDGATGGFFSDSTSASSRIWDTVNLLLRLDRKWQI